MPQNNRNNDVRKRERIQRAKQEREIKELADALERGDDEPIIPTTNEDRLRRGARRADNKKHKPQRHRDHDDQSS